MSLNTTLVIVPTLNEEENIDVLLNELFSLPVDVLIVDDGSKDQTIEKARAFDTSGRRINFLLRDKKFGLGNAYRAGYAWGIERGYERIVQMDADGSHQVSDLERMLVFSDDNPNVELVIGSRWTKGGKVINWNKGRELLSRLANRYTQALIKLDVKDATAGFRIYRKSLLERMDIQGVQSEGYCYQIEMTREALNVNAVISEIPITFKEREFGTSKMSMNIVIEAMYRVTYWGLFKNNYHFGLMLLAIFTSFTTFMGLGQVQRSEYYASIAMSMSKNLGNFFFGAIDPAGTVTLDKIPGSYWVAAIFVKVFGFSTWSIIAPNAIATVVLVVVVAMIGKRLFGTTAALIAGAIVSTTPIVIAVARANQPQSMFLLALSISVFWAIKALDSLRRRDLVIAGAFIALAFHTYMLVAWALWPALIIAWLFTRQSFRKKVVDLLIAGTTSLLLSLTWILIVWAVPAAHRPYIGGTYHDNPFEMVFGYNGLGRFSSTTSALSSTADDPNFRSFTPPFGGSAGLGRIFSEAVAGQIAWLIPSAVLSFVLLLIMRKKTSITIFLSLWFATLFAMFSLVSGIHQFYTSSLAIPVALLISGAVTESLKEQKRIFTVALISTAAISALLFSGIYPDYMNWVAILQAVLAGFTIILVIMRLRNKVVIGAFVATSLVAAPASWAIDARNFTNSINPIAGNVISMGGGMPNGLAKQGGNFSPQKNGVRPNFDPRMQGAPPKGMTGFDPNERPGKLGGQGFPSPANGQVLPKMADTTDKQKGAGNFGQQDVSTTVSYLQANRHGAKFLLVTFGAQSAAAYITATGDNILPIGGFDGQDPTPTLSAFKKMVTAGEVRYVLLNSEGGMGGGFKANSEIKTWVSANCTQDSASPVTSLYICSPSGT